MQPANFPPISETISHLKASLSKSDYERAQDDLNLRESRLRSEKDEIARKFENSMKHNAILTKELEQWKLDHGVLLLGQHETQQELTDLKLQYERLVRESSVDLPRLKQERDEFELKLVKSVKEVEILKKQCGHLSQENGELVVKNAGLEREVRVLKGEIVKVDEERKEAVRSEKEARVMCEKLRDELETAEQCKKVELEKTNEKKKKAEGKLEVVMIAASDRYKELTQRVTKLENDVAALSCYSASAEARGQLTPLQTGDATPEEVAAEAERVREEERAARVAAQTKKAPVLVPRQRLLQIDMGPGGARKRSREDAQRGTPASRTPRSMGGPSGGRSQSPPLAERVESKDTPGRGSSRLTGAKTPPAGPGLVEPAAGQDKSQVDFLEADLATKLARVQEVAGLLNTAAVGQAGSSRVSEEEVAVAEVLVRTMRGAAERRRLEEAATKYKRRWEKLRDEQERLKEDKAKRVEEKGQLEKSLADLQGQLAEATARAEAEAARAVEAAQRSREESESFFRTVLATLSVAFQAEGYFDAYVKYVRERQEAEAQGRDPEELEFPMPPVGGDDPEDDATTPLEDVPPSPMEQDREGSEEASP